ncbi:hypothetical protein CQW23_28174 [Capsicum baccatum]|uniref:Xylanase inhibitor N-terminal domain-containing protein n=1 Tax=Capsicum baccatum TaxID=33114 RepID=A0A2G2VFV8_CAPBA|nr:hypothetical protein CQW23_28174 [Capsicum baccatum]
MSSSFGLLGEDVLSFGNRSELGPERSIFGCEIAETGDPSNQRADGIMGLGQRDISIVDQLIEKHLISDSFTLCYVGFDARVKGSDPSFNDIWFSGDGRFKVNSLDGTSADQINAVIVAKECLLAALKEDSKASCIWTNLANAYYLMSDHRISSKFLEKVLLLQA